MHDALAVRGIQRIGHGECDVHEHRDLDRAAPEPLLEFLRALDDPAFDRTIPQRVPSGLPVGGRLLP